MPLSVSQYIYGNSLANYAEGGANTNIAVWMDQFAESAGNTLELSGGFGFLRDFADRSTPSSEWGFSGVDPAWDAETEGFAAAEIDTFLIVPNNFIQDQDPTANYVGDTRSPVDATAEIVSETVSAHPDARVFIYEGWADLAPFSETVPATNAGLQEYHAYNTGAYHDWYEEYVSDINAAVPGADVQLIPVASVLSEMLTTTLSDIPPDELYVDSAPHGTETIYFLASMVTYSSVYGEPVPANFAVPDAVHPSVAANFDTLVQQAYDGAMDALNGGFDPTPIVVDDSTTGDSPSDDGSQDAPVDTPTEENGDATDGGSAGEDAQDGGSGDAGQGDSEDETPTTQDNEGPGGGGQTQSPTVVSSDDDDQQDDDQDDAEQEDGEEDAAENEDDSVFDGVLFGAAAQNDRASVDAGDVLRLDVTANDIGAVELIYIDAPRLGTAQIEDGMVVYSANADASGTDSFSYVVAEGNGLLSEGQITIHVNGGNGLPGVGQFVFDQEDDETDDASGDDDHDTDAGQDDADEDRDDGVTPQTGPVSSEFAALLQLAGHGQSSEDTAEDGSDTDADDADDEATDADETGGETEDQTGDETGDGTAADRDAESGETDPYAGLIAIADGVYFDPSADGMKALIITKGGNLRHASEDGTLETAGPFEDGAKGALEAGSEDSAQAKAEQGEDDFNPFKMLLKGADLSDVEEAAHPGATFDLDEDDTDTAM